MYVCARQGPFVAEYSHMYVHACLYRWDLQRARTLLEHQELLKKYNKKSGAAETVTEKKKEKVVTFSSKLEDGRPACISFSRWL